MKKTIFMDKYPIHSFEVLKSEINQKSVDELVEYFRDKIEAHPIAHNIAIFDHYEHTTNIKGDINPDIKDAKNIIFCFGQAIPNSKILAIRPRSIGVCELEDKFIIDFLEAPKEKIQEIMTQWTKELKK
ncbi:hypothetical protein MNB_SV-15-943 [hydrothermal vent metagenome]|uniref:Uncharacterized protein n=1 Tax=hydrothermal vent metagenome TaxID=652676 RepID=A0A1W1EKK9_9ZZZZ